MNFKIADSKFKELLLPTLLIVMALNLSSVIDTFFVGSFIGKNAVAAIALLEPMMLLVTVLEWLFGLGGQILSLNKKAEFDIEGSNRFFTTSVVVSMIASLVFTLISLLFLDQLATILGSSPATKPLVMEYSTYLYGCFFVSTVMGILIQYIRVDGQPNFASAIIIISNIINIILDYIFLSSGMGMASASLASFIGFIVGLLLCLIYILNPKRTFRFVKDALKIKTFIKNTWEMIKVGFPGASVGAFDVVFVYLLNLFLGSTLGDIGLTTYMVCTDALVIASIVDVGVSETLTSIVPIYYTKHDYVNLNHLIKNSLLITVTCAIIMMAVLWIWPEGFLTLYNFNKIDIKNFIANALRLYSPFFIVSVLPNLLVFYYEAIERPVLSSTISILYTLIMPLVSIVILYNMIGSNGIWIGFAVGTLISLVIVHIMVKVIQKREPKYSGLFFIEKDLVSKTKNFVLTNNDLNARKNCLKHLQNLNASEEFCDNTNKIFNTIFETNTHDTYVEVLIIDYEDNIHLDIKYDGEKENMNKIKDKFPKDLLNYAEVLGFNTIEYAMKKN